MRSYDVSPARGDLAERIINAAVADPAETKRLEMDFRGVLVARSGFLPRLVSGDRFSGGRDELRRGGFPCDPRQRYRTVAG